MCHRAPNEAAEYKDSYKPAYAGGVNRPGCRGGAGQPENPVKQDWGKDNLGCQSLDCSETCLAFVYIPQRLSAARDLAAPLKYSPR